MKYSPRVSEFIAGCIPQPEETYTTEELLKAARRALSIFELYKPPWWLGWTRRLERFWPVGLFEVTAQNGAAVNLIPDGSFEVAWGVTVDTLMEVLLLTPYFVKPNAAGKELARMLDYCPISIEVEKATGEKIIALPQLHWREAGLDPEIVICFLSEAVARLSDWLKHLSAWIVGDGVGLQMSYLAVNRHHLLVALALAMGSDKVAWGKRFEALTMLYTLAIGDGQPPLTEQGEPETDALEKLEGLI